MILILSVVEQLGEPREELGAESHVSVARRNERINLSIKKHIPRRVSGGPFCCSLASRSVSVLCVSLQTVGADSDLAPPEVDVGRVGYHWICQWLNPCRIFFSVPRHLFYSSSRIHLVRTEAMASTVL